MSQNKQVTVEKIFHEAHRAMAQKNPVEARNQLQEALKIDSKQAKLWHLLADTYLATHNPMDAILILESALTDSGFTPDDRISLQIHLASTHIRTGDLGAASRSIDLGTVTKLRNPVLSARVGYLLAICEEHSAALSAFETALSLDQNNPELLFNTAAAHRSMGNLETAESMYDRVLRLAPGNYPAYWLRSSLRKQTADNNHINELEHLASAGSTPEKGKIHLCFSLAKELDDLERYEESFSALKKGAEKKKNSIGYSVAPDLAAVEEIRKTYNQDAISKRSETDNSNGDGIIFILGMPRTGSTLIDRILSTNEKVDSSGEPDTFAQILYQSAMQASGIRELSKKYQLNAIQKSIDLDFKEIGKTYQEKLKLRAKQKNSHYIIDKNPSNFLYFGAIRLALPHAKIIHIRRNPMDTCYAIYKTLFKNGHPYSYDLNDLAVYYCAYRQLMDHWMSIFGNNYFELSYEDLIAKPEKTSNDLMDYCELEWSENCLKFYRNTKKGTATASAAQIRQPIYSSSIETWRNYEHNLEPLSRILSEHRLI